MVQTSAYVEFVRGVRERRRTLLRDHSDKIIYPPLGHLWEPSRDELTRCDAFILFYVAELEYYFELVLKYGLDAYNDVFSVYFLRHCKGADSFITKISEHKTNLTKNNNANWSRISHFFAFLGMGKESHFPEDFWDDIENIVSHRGHIAHNGARLRVDDDRRGIIRKMEITVSRIKSFDNQYQTWLNNVNAEKTRVELLDLEFKPDTPLIV